MDNIAQYVNYLMVHSTASTPLWNVEAIHDKSKIKWNYVDGCMIKAIIELYYITKEKRYLDFADNFVDYYISDDGSIKGFDLNEYNLDSINEGKVLFDLFEITKKQKYRLAIDKLMEQVNTHPRTKSNNLWHKKIYPNQVWLDGLYMAQPFYMEYEVRFDQKKNYEDVLLQFRNVYKFLHDPETNLLFHGWDESKSMFWANQTTGCSKSFWSRSLGWYAMALIDTIEKTNDFKSSGALELGGYLKELIQALLTYQDAETGMWYQVTDKVSAPGNYLETSGTAMFAYAILKGVRLGVLPSTWQTAGKKAFDGIVKKYLHIEGEKLWLGGICLVAGLGGMNGKGNYTKRDGTYEYYISEPVVDNDAKGVGPFLLAYTEVVRIK